MVDNGKTKLYIVVYYHPLIGRDSSYSFFVFEINELTGNTFIGDNYLYYKDFNTVDHL